MVVSLGVVMDTLFPFARIVNCIRLGLPPVCTQVTTYFPRSQYKVSGKIVDCKG